MTNPNVELAARRARMDMADGATAAPQLVAVQEALAPDVKSFRGSYLLYRQRGKGMGPTRPPSFRHQSRELAYKEAERLLAIYPKATFLIMQEVGRVKLKVVDPDAATGCADDQTFAAVPISGLRKAAGMPEGRE